MPVAPSFDYTPEQIKDLSSSLIKDLETKIDEILKIPAEQRTFANTVYAFEEASAVFQEKLTIPVFLAYTSSSKELRDAAMQLEMAISQYAIDLNTREDIFNALKEYADKGEKLDEVDARLLDKTLLAVPDHFF